MVSLGSVSSYEPHLGLGLGAKHLWRRAGMPWALEGTGICGGSCPESEAAPIFRGLPQAAPMQVSLLSKHVVMGMWQEQAGLPLGALQPSYASAFPVERMTDRVRQQ